MDSYDSSSDESDSHDRSSSPRSRGRTLDPSAQRYGSFKRKPSRSYPKLNPVFVDTAGTRIGAVPGDCRCCAPKNLIFQKKELVRPVQRTLAFAGAAPRRKKFIQTSLAPQAISLDTQQLYRCGDSSNPEVRRAILPLPRVRQGDSPDNR